MAANLVVRHKKGRQETAGWSVEKQEDLSSDRLSGQAERRGNHPRLYESDVK